MSVIADPAYLAALWDRIRAMLARACFEIGAFDPLAALTPERRLSIARWIALIETIVRKVLLVEATALLVAERTARAADNGPRLTFIPLQGLAQTLAVVPTLPKSTSAGAGEGMTNAKSTKRERGASSDACAAGGRALQPSRIRVFSSHPLASPHLLPSPSRGGGTQVARVDAKAFDAMQPETWRVRFDLKPPCDPRACTQRPRIRALWGDDVVQIWPSPCMQGERAPSALRLAMRIEALRRVLANPAPHIKRLAHLLPKLCARDPKAFLRYATEPARPHRSDEADPRLVIEAIALALDAAPHASDSS
jgi:hypothetical protein